MLPERDYHLLTAYVDGELSPRRRKAVQRVLRRSPEARAFLRQLQADADRLRRLPRPRLDDGFTEQVMQRVAALDRHPTARPAARAAGWPAWFGYAAAAAVLLAVGAGSYLAFPLLFPKDRPERSLVKKNEPDPRSPAPRDVARAAPRPDRRRPDKPVEPPKGDDPSDLVLPGTEDETPEPEPVPAPSAPRVVHKARPPQPGPTNPVLGSRPVDPELPPITHPRLSFLAPVADLRQQVTRDRLLAKLHGGDAFHVQLLCRDPARGLHRLREALGARGLQLVMDQAAQERLNNRRLRAKFVLYAENLRPEELLDVFGRLAPPTKPAANRKPPESFGAVVVSPMSPRYRQQVVRFLGSPPAGKAANAKAPRLVLGLAYNEDNSPVRARPGPSPELKRFRGSRPPRLPGTVQIVVELSRDQI